MRDIFLIRQGRIIELYQSHYETEFSLKQFPDVHAGIVKWPMSVIRLQGENTESIVKAADHILMLWRRYTDEKAFIFSETNGVSHNTITPIARKKGNLFEYNGLIN